MSSPTQRSLQLLRKRGYLVDIVERWIPRANIRKDLWGWCDLLCVRDTEILAVQCTSASNVSKRVAKITDSPNLPAVRKAGIGVRVHGWAKRKGRWQVREVDLS